MTISASAGPISQLPLLAKPRRCRSEAVVSGYGFLVIDCGPNPDPQHCVLDSGDGLRVAHHGVGEEAAAGRNNGGGDRWGGSRRSRTVAAGWGAVDAPRPLSGRANIPVFAQGGHSSQYRFDVRLKRETGEILLNGVARHLNDAPANATSMDLTAHLRDKQIRPLKTTLLALDFWDYSLPAFGGRVIDQHPKNSLLRYRATGPRRLVSIGTYLQTLLHSSPSKVATRVSLRAPHRVLALTASRGDTPELRGPTLDIALKTNE